MALHSPAGLALADHLSRRTDPGLILRRAGLIGLVAAISLSPRILLPVVIPGRQFDIRFEDLIVLLCLAGWVLAIRSRPRLFMSPLFAPIGVYVTIVAFSTGIAIMTLGLNPMRAVPFFAKEVEYFIVFLLVANLARTREDIKITTFAVIAGGAINAAWVAVQILTTVKMQLFPIIGLRPTQDPMLAQRLYESYGPVLVGESSPLATGGFFLLIFLMVFSYALTFQTPLARFGSLTISGVLFGCIVFSESRVAMVGGVVGLAVLAGINRTQRKTAVVAGSLIVITALVLNQAYFRYERATGVRVVWLAEGAESATMNRLSSTKISHGVDDRLGLWEEVLSESPNLLTGSGKGSLGSLPGPDIMEAHNHYLRVLVESGPFGVIAFLWVLAGICRLCVRAHERGALAVTKGISGAALAATLGLAAGAVVQDVFTPVILNEMLWVLIGLTAVAYRIERPPDRSTS